MDQVLAYWQSKGVDGFRCDMAHLIPREVWEYLIAAARSPERDTACFFLAEAYPASAPGAPITKFDDLIAAGFNAVYHSPSYNALKRIYQGFGSQEDYDQAVSVVSSAFGPRASWLAYLENDGERRVASPVVTTLRDQDGIHEAGPVYSGFGSPEAGYQLAPLQFLFGTGPVLLFNGQEVGESGAGVQGFSPEDGRTTTFDYGSMPQFVKWVNGHAYDGGGLSASQNALRRFYGDLLALCQDPSVRGDGYWGLKYFNRHSQFSDCPDDLYSFARFQEQSGRLLLVVANFRPHSGVDGRVRVPAELAMLVELSSTVTVQLILDQSGVANFTIARQTRQSLISDGFPVSLPNQTTQVFVIE